VLGVLAGFDRVRDGPQFSVRDEQLLSAFAASAAAAVATAQDVAAQALQRSIAAVELERTRWAPELHDETLQELAALKLLLATVRIAKDADERETQLKHAADRIDSIESTAGERTSVHASIPTRRPFLSETAVAAPA
jgi:signal transduction histidine kinase